MIPPVLLALGIVSSILTLLQLRFGFAFGNRNGFRVNGYKIHCQRSAALVRRGIWARALEWLGGFEIHKSGNRQWDAHWYIASDDPQLVRAMSSEKSVHLLLQVVQLHPKIKQIHISKGRLDLSMHLNPKNKEHLNIVQTVYAQAAPLISKLDALWCEQNAALKKPWEDAYGKWHALLEMVVFSVILTTVIVVPLAWLNVLTMEGSWLLSNEQLIPYWIFASVIAILLVMWLLASLFWGSRRLVKVLTGVGVPLSLCVAFAMPSVLKQINQMGVKGSAYEGVVQVHVKTAQVTNKRRKSTVYRAYVRQQWDQVPAVWGPNESTMSVESIVPLQQMQGVRVLALELGVSEQKAAILKSSPTGAALVRVQQGVFGWPVMQFMLPCVPTSVALVPPDKSYQGQLESVRADITNQHPIAAKYGVRMYYCMPS